MDSLLVEAFFLVDEFDDALRDVWHVSTAGDLLSWDVFGHSHQ